MSTPARAARTSSAASTPAARSRAASAATTKKQTQRVAASLTTETTAADEADEDGTREVSPGQPIAATGGAIDFDDEPDASSPLPTASKWA